MITSTLTYMMMLLALCAAESDSNDFQTSKYDNLTTSNGYKAGIPLPQLEKSQKIFGGKYVRSIKKFPYMVFIYTTEGEVCGGTVLGPKYVLTAAHCIRSYDHIDKTNYTDRKSESFTVNVGSVIPEKAKTQVKVKRHFVHPKYKEFDEVNKCQCNYDVAIMELKKRIKFTKKISKVKLPTLDKHSMTNCEAIGWGLTEKDFNADYPLGYIHRTLKYASVDVISTEECLEQLKIYFGGKDVGYASHFCTDTQICTIDPENKNGICTGDSGGPLVCNGVQVGVISMSVGSGCVGPHMPMYYSRLDINVEWINSIIKS